MYDKLVGLVVYCDGLSNSSLELGASDTILAYDAINQSRDGDEMVQKRQNVAPHGATG